MREEGSNTARHLAVQGPQARLCAMGGFKATSYKREKRFVGVISPEGG